MNKKLIIILIVVVLGILAMYMFIDLEDKEISITDSDNIQQTNFVEIEPICKSFKLTSFYDEKDMLYINGIYFKKISTYEEYQYNKKIWNNITDMTEKDFNNSFMIIAIVENRNGFTLGDLFIDEDTLYVGFKKHDTKTLYDSEERGIEIIVPSNMNRDKIETYKTVDKKYDVHNLFSDVKDIPQDYSIEQAIQDGCFVLADEMKTYNVEKINEFMSKVNNKKDATIKIARYDGVYIRQNGEKELEYSVVKYVSKYDRFVLCRKGNDRGYYSDGQKWSSCNYYTYSKIEEREVSFSEGTTVYSLIDETLGEYENDRMTTMCAIYSGDY